MVTEAEFARLERRLKRETSARLEAEAIAERGLRHLYQRQAKIELLEAIAIAKENPEFEYGTTATIEVRPVKMMEDATGFVYPGQTLKG